MFISYLEPEKVRKAKAFCKEMGYTYLYDMGEWFAYSYMGTTGTYSYYLIPQRY